MEAGLRVLRVLHMWSACEELSDPGGSYQMV